MLTDCRRLMLKIGVSLSLAAAWTATPVAASEPAVLARVGAPAPGGGTFFQLYQPQINESGIVLFRAIVDHGAGGQRQQWYLIDTYASLEPVLALTVGPAPDGSGALTPVVAVLGEYGGAVDFYGGLEAPAPMTGTGGWFVRGEDGAIVERLREGRPLAAGGAGGPGIACAYNLRIHPDRNWIVQTRLVDAPEQCQGAGQTGPRSTYRIAPDHSVERLVGEGDSIVNRPGATIGPTRQVYPDAGADRLLADWSDGGSPWRPGLFRLGPDGPQLEVADGDELPGVGIVHLGASVLSDLGPQGYLGKIRVQPAQNQPVRDAIVRLDASGGAVLLQAGQDLPGFGRLFSLNAKAAGTTVGLVAGLVDEFGTVTGFGALSVDVDGRIRLGARSGSTLPGTLPVLSVLQGEVLPSGAMVHSVQFDDGWGTHALAVAGDDAPTLLLAPTVELDTVVYQFALLQLTTEALRWTNSRGQVVALAQPRLKGGFDPRDLIVYYGSAIFRGTFELD